MSPSVPRAVILDTNLLLLWLVARVEPRLLERFKRVQMFTYDDIQLLADLLQPFQTLITTPHILAEASNFVDQSPLLREPLVTTLRQYAEQFAEIYTPAASLMQREEFLALGLTDTGLAELSKRAVVLTTDYQLSGRIERSGRNAMNFNHHRSRSMLAP